MRNLLIPLLLAWLGACQSAPAPEPIPPPTGVTYMSAPPDDREPVEPVLVNPPYQVADPRIGVGNPPRIVTAATPRRPPQATAPAQRAARSVGSTAPEAAPVAAAPRVAAPAQAAAPAGAPCASDGECGVREGRGGFATPRKMWINTPETLEFIVAPDDAGIAQEADGAKMGPTGAIYIGSVMRVTLRPHSNFEILSANGIAKPLGRDRRESWQWEVKPKDREGTFKLFADVEILASMDPNAPVLEAYSKRVDVSVRVGKWDGFRNALGKAQSAGELFSALFRSWETALISLTALIVALGGTILAIRNLGPKGRERRAARREKRVTKKAVRVARRQQRKAQP